MSIRLLTTLAAATGLAVLAVGPATAANPHFVSASASPSGSGVTVSFKEAGLGGGSTQTIQVSGTYTALFECINGGGKNPSAANKSTETDDVATSGTFRADRNGNVTGSLTLAAPDITTNALECPRGQREQLSALTWSGLEVADLTSGARRAF